MLSRSRLPDGDRRAPDISSEVSSETSHFLREATCGSIVRVQVG